MYIAWLVGHPGDDLNTTGKWNGWEVPGHQCQGCCAFDECALDNQALEVFGCCEVIFLSISFSRTWGTGISLEIRMGIMDWIVSARGRKSGRTRDTKAKGVWKLAYEAFDEGAFTNAWGAKMTTGGSDIVVVPTLHNTRISVSVACKTDTFSSELTGLHSKRGCSPLC